MALVLGPTTARTENKGVLKIALNVANAPEINAAASRADIMIVRAEATAIDAFAVLPGAASLTADHESVLLGHAAEAAHLVPRAT
jgi:hypothetical protein